MECKNNAIHTDIACVLSRFSLEQNMANMSEHDSNREKVCLFCLNKKMKTKNLTFSKILPNSKLEEKINKHFRYNALEKNLPNVVCDKCRRKLYEKGQSIERPDLNSFRRTIMSTRSMPSNGPCVCKICRIVDGTPLFETTALGFIPNIAASSKGNFKLTNN